MADQTGMKALHMFTAGDPARNGTFVFFADANYFITDFPASTCETCINPAFARNHGDVQKEIGQTWVGCVGPGVASQPDQRLLQADQRSFRVVRGRHARHVHQGAHVERRGRHNVHVQRVPQIAVLTTQRDALAAQIRGALDGAAFGTELLDPVLAAGWVSQAQTLLTSADTLAAAP